MAISDNIEHKIDLLDIGARDNIEWPWSENQHIVEAILVEPDPKEAKRLSRETGFKVLPCALWNKEMELDLSINKSPGTSSVFRSNMTLLHQFHDADRFKSQNIIKVQAKTVKSLFKERQIDNVDFVKIDVQGAEKAILEGGEDFFKEHVVGLEVEVEFSHIYIDQPLFGEVDEFIRGNLGLELWDIRRTFWKYKEERYSSPLKGRLIFGDALYLRSVATLEEWLSGMPRSYIKRKINALFFTAKAYGFLDYARAVVKHPFVKDHFSDGEIEGFNKELDKLSRSLYPFKKGSRILFRIFNALANSFKPSSEGWAEGDSRIGSRKRWVFWS